MNPKIIVIGAGVSGIAASTKLLENGFNNLTILEGENRIGGRISTVSFSYNFAELGAQWCHGEKGNVVYELAHKYDLFDSTKTDIKDLFVRSNGEKIDKGIGDRLTELARTILYNLKKEIRAKIKLYEGSIGCYVIPKFYEALAAPEYQDIDRELADEFITFFGKFVNSLDSSNSWFESSAKTYLYYWECEGDGHLNWKDNGYKTFLDILTKKYPEPSEALPIDDKILLNKTVDKISWNQGEDSAVKVECEDGSVYSADHVIVTMSLGVLKERHLDIFAPPLPIIKRNAIEGLNFGTVNKIIMEFNQPFWDEGWTGFSLLWTETDLAEIRKTENAWLEDIHGIYILDYQPNTLFGWISGVNSRRMEQATDSNVREGMLFLLKKFLKNPNVPDPLRVIRSNWFTNRNFRGSYSFRSLVTDKAQTYAEHLALPLKNSIGIDALQFAGEATHDHYYSTVHGAVETGWREAKRIIDFYQKNPFC